MLISNNVIIFEVFIINSVMLLHTVSITICHDICQRKHMSHDIIVDCSSRGLINFPSETDLNVTILLLANNNIDLFANSLENYKNLKILDLSQNYLEIGAGNYFSHLKNLQMLNLSYNKYDYWKKLDLGESLEMLDISYNYIKYVEPDGFRLLTKLKYLNLTGNRLTDVGEDIVIFQQQLVHLSLSRNYIKSVPKIKSTSIKYLDLSQCDVADIERESLNDLTTLIELNLSQNSIERVPDYLCSQTLEYLDLSFNEIEYLTEKSFSNLPKIKLLNLSGNQFNTIPNQAVFASNELLTSIVLTGNRWSCENFSSNLLLTYDYLTRSPSKVADSMALVCHSPSNVTGMTWQNAYLRTWHRTKSELVISNVSTFIIGAVIGIVLTTLICQCITARSDRPVQTVQTTVNTSVAAPSVQLRLEEDLPPSYNEALLMPRLDGSFHSLPDYLDLANRPITPIHCRMSRSTNDLLERGTSGLDNG